jgi:hypothetical protein
MQKTDAGADIEWTLLLADQRLGVILKCWQGYGNLLREKDQNSGLMTELLCVLCWEFSIT